jgi:uncharacterized protein with FMN-binding domain
MELVLNYGLAWAAALSTILLSFKYIAKGKMQKIRQSVKTAAPYRYARPEVKAVKGRLWIALNKGLKKIHIPLGVALIAAGLIHGLNSSAEVLTVNLGTVTWITSILLGLNFLLRRALAKHKPWLVYHRTLTLIMVVLLFSHIVAVGGINVFSAIAEQNGEQTAAAEADGETMAGENSQVIWQSEQPAETPDASSAESKPEAAPSPSKTAAASESAPPAASSSTEVDRYLNSFGKDVVLKDGTYTGSATGYRPGLTVEVTVKGNRVTIITVVSHNERGPQHYAKPIKVVPGEIIDGQTLDVDTVSGATRTSEGIINAVNDALSKALVSGRLPNTR